jgi:hypothetical protein
MNVSQTRDFTLMRSNRLSLTHMAAFVDNALDTVDAGAERLTPAQSQCD